MLTPRKVTLMNSTTQSIIQELSFPTSVLALQINRKRCELPGQLVVHTATAVYRAWANGRQCLVL